MTPALRSPVPLLLLSLLAAFALFAPLPARAQASAQPQDRLAWWREARFGMFIHWGLYAIPGKGEWVQWDQQIPVNEYAKLADQFNPDHFDPDAWAATAKAAGMKYMVLTARHHDGFALFDDPASDFTSVKTAAHRDFVAQYVAAVRKAGLRVGLYYSPLDWRFPGFFFPDLQRPSAEAMRDQYHRQMTELLSNYGPLDILWFDGGEQDWLNFGADWQSGARWQKRPAGQHYKGTFSWQHDQVYQQLRKLQPGVLINGRADMPPDFTSREGDGALGNFDADHPWELCTTLSGAWGWQPDKPVKSLHDCIQLLIKAAGRDGNFLLNVGMRPDGQIDPPQVARLKEIGDWLGKYGQSIYATRGGPYLPGDFGVSTFHDKTIYLHILQPGKTLSLPPLPLTVVNSSCLTGGKATVRQDTDKIEISLEEDGDGIDRIVALTIDANIGGIKTIATPVTGRGRRGQ